jgi:hypothetical protein
MPSKRTSSNRNSPDVADPSQQPIDIDDAAIDETATVEPDEDLVELANPDRGKAAAEERPARAPGKWRERDANRRAHGPDDLKA